MLAALVAVSLPAEVRVPDLKGNLVKVLPTTAKRGLVVFIVITGCPNANGYVPEMNRIAKHYSPKGWDFRLVYADTFFSPQSILKHHKDYGYAFPALHDTSRVLVNLAGATKTPETAVFSPQGTLLYSGRIDDKYYALGKQRQHVRVHDLRLTLDAIQAGKPVPHKRTEAIGCYLPVD